MPRPTLCVAVLALAWVTACRDPGPCPEPCGTIVIATGSPISTLLPPVAQTLIDQTVADQLFLRLADLDLSMNTVDPEAFVPKLAAGWTAEDSVTLAFSLDPRARWHDGHPVTADDVVFTHAIYTDSDVGAAARPLLDQIVAVEARDSLTVIFRFQRPYLEQLYDATHHMRIIPRHALDSIPRPMLRDHEWGRAPVGNGPFRLGIWSPGQSLELVADTSFFLGSPGVSRLIWRIAGDPSALVTALVAGDVDFVEFLGSPENVERVERASDLRVVRYASAVYNYVGFNFRDPADLDQPHPLFADVRLRLALSMLTDRASITSAALGLLGDPIRGPLPPALRIADLEVDGVPFDTARGRELLESAGWADRDGDDLLDRNGSPLSFELLVPNFSGNRRRAALALQESFRPFGIEMRIAEVEGNTFGDRLNTGRFDAFAGSFGTSPNPGALEAVWTSEGVGAFNFGQYRNPLFDELVRATLDATDVRVERQLWLDAMNRLLADAPAIWLYTPIMAAGLHDRIDNVTIRPDMWGTTLWTWRVAPGRELARDRAPR